MDLNIVFSDKIGLLELYNFAVHQIHIKWWHHTEKYIWNKFSIHFPYILTLTSPLPSVFERVVHFELTVSTAKLLSSITPLIWYTSLGWSRGVFNFSFSNLGENGIKNPTSDSGSGARTTPGKIKNGKKFD